MAEFQEVIRQFDRMCKANIGCINCPLHDRDGVSDRCSISAFVNDSDNIEREVMAWAAEHPEPVYPTWADYISALVIKDICTGKISGPDTVLTYAMKTHIPADIAQKLGIEPKEG